jgi:transcription elongation factor GreB
VSKAFTSEETPDTAPLQPSSPRLAPGEVRYVTPEGQQALRDELSRLAAELAGAAALPEPERAARREELSRRLARAEATLGLLTVLSPAAAPEGQVGFGTWVTVEDPDGTATTWRIVGPDEADARRGRLSVHAPVARALLGRRVGDSTDVERPGGSLELRVVAIRRSAP